MVTSESCGWGFSGRRPTKACRPSGKEKLRRNTRRLLLPAQRSSAGHLFVTSLRGSVTSAVTELERLARLARRYGSQSSIRRWRGFRTAAPTPRSADGRLLSTISRTISGQSFGTKFGFGLSHQQENPA